VGPIKPGTYWYKICAKDTVGATFKLSAPSKLIQVVIPDGTNTNTATLTDIAWDSAAVGYVVLGGTDPNNLSRQKTDDSTPSSILLTSYNVADYGEPDVEADHVEVDVYKCQHAGNFGTPITGLTSTTFTIANALWTVDEWAGRDCSITGFLDDEGEIAIANFTVDSKHGGHPHYRGWNARSNHARYYCGRRAYHALAADRIRTHADRCEMAEQPCI